MSAPARLQSEFPGLFASAPEPLLFASSFDTRAFVLRREAGNLLVYSVAGLDAAAVDEVGGVVRHYLNHWHEAMFMPAGLIAPVFVHENDREEAALRTAIGGTFSERHTLDGDLEIIPIPGHTPGATAFLWESGGRRFLFTGDTVHLSNGEWTAILLESSDERTYIDSLESIRELDFDVLVPWAATAGDPYFALTSKADARRRIDAILAGLRGAGA